MQLSPPPPSSFERGWATLGKGKNKTQTIYHLFRKKMPDLLRGRSRLVLGFKAALLIRALHLLDERRLCQMAAALAFHRSNVSQFLIDQCTDS